MPTRSQVLIGQLWNKCAQSHKGAFNRPEMYDRDLILANHLLQKRIGAGGRAAPTAVVRQDEARAAQVVVRLQVTGIFESDQLHAWVFHVRSDPLHLSDFVFANAHFLNIPALFLAFNLPLLAADRQVSANPGILFARLLASDLSCHFKRLHILAVDGDRGRLLRLLDCGEVAHGDAGLLGQLQLALAGWPPLPRDHLSDLHHICVRPVREAVNVKRNQVCVELRHIELWLGLVVHRHREYFDVHIVLGEVGRLRLSNGLIVLIRRTVTISVDKDLFVGVFVIYGLNLELAGGQRFVEWFPLTFIRILCATYGPVFDVIDSIVQLFHETGIGNIHRVENLSFISPVQHK